MTSPDPLILDLDPSAYISGLGRAEDATQGFAGSMRTLPAAILPIQQAMNNLTPGRATLAGFTALAAAAGSVEAQLSTLRGQSTVTGASFAKLTGEMRSLARDLPIGNAGARQLVQSLTQLGVAAAGNERQIGAMARSFTRLGGATGEAPAALAQSMIQLNRAMGTGLSAKRIDALGDSLTTVSAKAGTSATATAQFAKMIAPMAQASGIGQTKLLGISAAMTRLGEDGFAAGNAIGRFMQDMSRSVREGSPQMAAYAEVVGKTRQEFEALFKNDPAEALTQVTEALGKNANAPRQLEALGFEGFRTQRVLQSLSNSGGLREQINTATGAYGSGSTQQASEEAFGGLFDSLSRLKSNSEQVAEAFGQPMLGPLTAVTDAMGALITPLRAIMGNGGVQTLLGAGAMAALPIMVLKKMVGAGLLAATAGQIATSGPIRSLLGGMALGRSAGDYGRAREGFLGRRGAWALDQRAANAGAELGRGSMVGINDRAYRIGQGVGAAMGGGGGVGGNANILRSAGAGGLGLYNLLTRMQAEQFRQARLPIDQRGVYDAKSKPFGEAQESINRSRANYNNARASLNDLADRGVIGKDAAEAAVRAAQQRAVSETTAALNKMRNEVGTNTGLLRQMGRAVSGTLGPRGVLGQGIATGASAGLRGAGAVAGALGGPVGIGIMAAMGGVALYQNGKKNEEDRNNAARESVSIMDEYRVAMGKATEATQDFAGRMRQSVNSMASGVTDQADAARIDAQDVIAAGQVDRPVQTFTGDAAAAGSMLRLQQQTYGMAPDEMARVSYDLINQYDQEGAQRALDIATGQGRGGSGAAIDQMYGTATPDVPTGPNFSTVDITQAVAGLARADGAGGLRGAAAGFGNFLSGGNGGSVSGLSAGQEEGAAQIAASISARGAQTNAAFGTEYAGQGVRADLDAAVAAAFENGNADLAERIVRDFGARNDVEGLDNVRATELRDAGSASALLAGQSEEFRNRYGSNGEVVERPQLREDYAAERLAGNKLQDWFSNQEAFAGNEVNTALTNLIGAQGTPESPQRQAEAMDAAMRAAREAGGSMMNLATEAMKAANELGNTASAAFDFLMALNQTAQAAARADFTREGGTQGQWAQQRAGNALEMANMDPSTDPTGMARKQGVADLQALQEETRSFFEGRLTQARESQVQMTRMERDYGRQRSYAVADFNLGITRNEEDMARQRFRINRGFNLQRRRGDEDYQRSIFVAERNFGIQRQRAERDFGIQMVDATEDYNRQRYITQRDFDKQMRRSIEDSARSMFDPYTRLQVQPVWDGGNLVGNLEEQVEQAQRQLNNLNRAREMGLSNDAINMLGLNDPKNAQQLAQTVSDIASDPQVAAALNGIAEQRQTVAEQLMGDPSNVNVQRQLEDLAQGLNDMAVAFDTQTGRARRAFAQQQADAVADFRMGMNDTALEYAKNLVRAEEDLNQTLNDMNLDHQTAMDRAVVNQATAMDRMATGYETTVQDLKDDLVRMNEVITADLTTMQGAFNNILAGEFVDFTDLTEDGLVGWDKLLDAFINGNLADRLKDIARVKYSVETEAKRDAALAARGDGVGYGWTPEDDALDIPGQPPQVDQMMHKLRAGMGENIPLNSGLRPGAITATGKPSYHGMGRAVDLPARMDVFNWIKANYPNSREIIFSPAGGRQVHNGREFNYTGVTKANHWDHVHWAMARGGAVHGNGTGTSDSVNARLSNGEHVWTADEVEKAGGHGAMRMMRAMVSQGDMRSMQAAGGTTYITYSSDSYTYDHSTRVEHVDVHAADTAEFFERMDALARQGNLTRPAQRRSR